MKKLDKYFSIWIRRRYADENGLVKCCTCDRVDYWKQMDAGHYYNKASSANRSIATRWVECNCHVQCVICNRVNKGNMDKYWTFMQETYDTETLKHLFDLARSEVHYMQHEIDEMTEKYKQKIREL